MTTYGKPDTSSTPPTVAEIGRSRDGTNLQSNRRMFVQFHAFTDCHDTASVVDAVRGAGIEAAVYESLTDPLAKPHKMAQGHAAPPPSRSQGSVFEGTAGWVLTGVLAAAVVGVFVWHHTRSSK